MNAVTDQAIGKALKAAGLRIGRSDKVQLPGARYARWAGAYFFAAVADRNPPTILTLPGSRFTK